MSIRFNIKDYFYPVPILKLRTFLERSQWSSEDELKRYQLTRLRSVLKHAYNNVPYYRRLFDALSLKPSKITDISDLKKVPYIDKDILKENFEALKAGNAERFDPYLCRTSGTSGKPVEFYRDRYGRIMEFCYYWRHWSWAGYRLGMPFAEFSLHDFLGSGIKDISHYSVLCNKLTLNPSQLSYENADKFIKAVKRQGALFLKGSPSSVHIFSILLEKRGYSDVSFKAVFTTGETLHSYQKEKIEKVLSCKVLDSYGQMEGLAAISQCPYGRYHVNSEYGILEIEKDEKLSNDRKIVGRVIGTALYNFAMPLVRYRTDDLVEIDAEKKICECGRSLPLIEKIYGRAQDAIVTKDGRFITNLFIIPEFVKGVIWFQITQESLDGITFKMVPDKEFNDKERAKLLQLLRGAVGKDMDIEVKYVGFSDIDTREKYRNVISHVKGIDPEG